MLGYHGQARILGATRRYVNEIVATSCTECAHRPARSTGRPTAPAANLLSGR